MKSVGAYVASRKVPSKYLGELNQLVRALGENDVTVLIRGEHGVGKAHLAQAIHDHSLAEKKHFVVIRCDSLSDNLSADDHRPLFDWINGGPVPWRLLGDLLRGGSVAVLSSRHDGAPASTRWVTFYFEEAGRLSRSGQSLLLQALQRQQQRALQASGLRQRIIAASSERLEVFVAEGRFNASLYALLDRFQVCLPALRDRQDDIPYLAALFIDEFGRRSKKNIKGLSDAAIEAIRNYSWPGNVRELRSLIAQMVAQAEPGTEIIDCEQLLVLIQRQIQILDVRPSILGFES